VGKTKADTKAKRRARTTTRRAASGTGGLALLRGPKAVTRKPPPWPLVDAKVVRAVTAVLKNEELCSLTGGSPGEFEKRFAKYHGRKYALMVNGGTAALQLALAGCGVEPGDEVITSPYSWGATTGCILHHNAIPVFVDIDPETLNLDPAKLERRITDRTKAILPVHIYGLPADMAAIMKVANKHGVMVVEDCSQAAGAKMRSKLVGSLGHVGAFSLQASKNLTGGEGGILVTNERAVYERALAHGTHPVRQHAELKDAELKRYIDSLGFNFRPHPLAAAMANAQLPLLAGWVREKNRNFERLFKRLEGIVEPHGAEFMRAHKSVVHGYHMVSFRIAHPELAAVPRAVIADALRAEGMNVGGYVGTPIPLRPRFRDLVFYGRGCPWTCRHTQRLPDYSAGNWPVAERVCGEGELLLYGNHYVYDPKLMDQYATAFEKLVAKLDALRGYAEKHGAR